MVDNEKSKYVCLESKVYIKYLGVLIDQHLSWKYHINSVVTKISKNVGLIAKLRHSVPRPILLNIYKSLVHPYEHAIPLLILNSLRDQKVISKAKDN